MFNVYDVCSCNMFCFSQLLSAVSFECESFLTVLLDKHTTGIDALFNPRCVILSYDLLFIGVCL